MKRGRMYRVQVRYESPSGLMLREFRGEFIGIDEQSQFPAFSLKPLAPRLVIPYDWFVAVFEAEYRHGPMMPVEVVSA